MSAYDPKRTLVAPFVMELEPAAHVNGGMRATLFHNPTAGHKATKDDILAAMKLADFDVRRAWTRGRNPADPPSAWKTVNRFGIQLRHRSRCVPTDAPESPWIGGGQTLVWGGCVIISRTLSMEMNCTGRRGNLRSFDLCRTK